MKTLIMALVLVLVLLTVANAQQADKTFNFSSSVSTTADTTSVSSNPDKYVTQSQVSLNTETYNEEDVEKIEEVNGRSTALLLATIVGYAIYILSISGK